MKLLNESQFDDITYQQIADDAGIPLASCYHFYKSKLDLIRVLADEITDEYLAVVLARERFKSFDNWRDCVAALVRYTVEHHNKNPAELQIFFGGSVSFKIRLDAVRREKMIGTNFQDILKYKFDLPPLEDGETIFFRAIEIARTVLALDFQEKGLLNDFSVTEATRALTGYLAFYLPTVLNPKKVEPDRIQ